MAAQVVRVAQVMRVCDYIRFEARCRGRQEKHVRGDMGGARGCMEVHGADSATSTGNHPAARI